MHRCTAETTGNKYVLGFLRQISTCTFAAERRAAAPLLLSTGRAAIGGYLLDAGRPAANPQQRSAAGEWWDRWTDARPLHGPCSASDSNVLHIVPVTSIASSIGLTSCCKQTNAIYIWSFVTVY